MKANRAYRLLARRGGLGPSFLAGPDRVDHLEIVEIDSGEVILFWDRAPREAARMARAIRADLAQLDPEAFLERWAAVE